ncbi:serine protease inhibitor Cvsi-1-like [Saccostrea cucullata]|uniref:serine protease inhibitor Cvsi-1-like n=1 Tax=Saccostrea cuccullata TaxID=36930 RepID=UPI002ED21C91
MGFLRTLVLLVCLLGVSLAARCNSDGVCTSNELHCADGYVKGCHSGMCTCEHATSTRCSYVNDCLTLGHCSIHGKDGFWHCADSVCKCFFF